MNRAQRRAQRPVRHRPTEGVRPTIAPANNYVQHRPPRPMTQAEAVDHANVVACNNQGGPFVCTRTLGHSTDGEPHQAATVNNSILAEWS